MDLTTINSAIEAAYADAIANGGIAVPPETIAPNVTLQTDAYVAPEGAGFRVVACVSVPEANYTAVRVKNHGPDVGSEREWPVEGIEAAAKAHLVRSITAAADFVNRSGFDADKKVILLNKWLRIKEANEQANYPKLVALYTWMETVQNMAVSGLTLFPKVPYSFEQVLSE